MPAPALAITGGASGLGAAVARRWSAGGGFVVALDRNGDLLAEVVEGLGGREHALGLAVDVSDTDAVSSAFASVRDALGSPLKGLVNCAGIAAPAPASSVAIDAWSGLLDVHLTGTMRSCQAAYPLLKADGGAAIVNVSSVASCLGMPGRSAYAAAKTGIEGLTRTLAVEWARDGIRVNAVAPGYIDSAMTTMLVETGKLRIEPILARTPMRRLAAADEIAAVICFLISSEASYVTGQVLRVDGGMSVEGNWYDHD